MADFIGRRAGSIRPGRRAGRLRAYRSVVRPGSPGAARPGAFPAAILATLALPGAAPLSAATLPEPEPRPRVEKIRIDTGMVNRPVRVRVWLPAEAEEAPPGSIPLLVFLHDGYGSERSFGGRGLDAILDEAVRRGEVPPVVVASPRTKGSFNMNNRKGTRRIEDFLATELVPRLLERFPVLRRDRAGRAVTGISVGGYGAVKLAVKYPALFGSASALSTWVEDLSFDYVKERFWLFRLYLKRRFGRTAETSTLSRESLFNIIPEASAGPEGFPPLLLVSGKSDPWVTDGKHRRLEEALSAAGIDHTVRIHPGEHDWDFWRAHFLEAVRFHAGIFQGGRPRAGAGPALPGGRSGSPGAPGEAPAREGAGASR